MKTKLLVQPEFNIFLIYQNLCTRTVLQRTILETMFFGFESNDKRCLKSVFDKGEMRSMLQFRIDINFDSGKTHYDF